MPATRRPAAAAATAPRRWSHGLALASRPSSGRRAGGVVVACWSVSSATPRPRRRGIQQFVDTASQTVVNMFSYTQDNIDDSVNRFVNGTSGPLRDMMSQGNNVDNLKAIFRDTNASSEAVINGAALEKVDDIGDNASVLVSVRVTVTDLDGVNTAVASRTGCG